MAANSTKVHSSANSLLAVCAPQNPYPSPLIVDENHSQGVKPVALSDCKAANSDVTQHAGKPKKFVCTVAGCNKSFGMSGHYKRHLKSHAPVKPFSCAVEGCTSRFTRQDNMMAHYRMHRSRVQAQESAYHPKPCDDTSVISSFSGSSFTSGTSIRDQSGPWRAESAASSASVRTEEAERASPLQMTRRPPDAMLLENLMHPHDRGSDTDTDDENEDRVEWGLWSNKSGDQSRDGSPARSPSMSMSRSPSRSPPRLLDLSVPLPKIPRCPTEQTSQSEPPSQCPMPIASPMTAPPPPHYYQPPPYPPRHCVCGAYPPNLRSPYPYSFPGAPSPPVHTPGGSTYYSAYPDAERRDYPYYHHHSCSYPTCGYSPYPAYSPHPASTAHQTQPQVDYFSFTPHTFSYPPPCGPAPSTEIGVGYESQAVTTLPTPPTTVCSYGTPDPHDQQYTMHYSPAAESASASEKSSTGMAPRDREPNGTTALMRHHFHSHMKCTQPHYMPNHTHLPPCAPPSGPHPARPAVPSHPPYRAASEYNPSAGSSYGAATRPPSIPPHHPFQSTQTSGYPRHHRPSGH
ncbi:hypothetical protein BC832DRAFT_345655 [Gaertneriomyces semiglobifer]|nr:hypothetical protein BC832DRAFT_345655 [Gaertneriomyces semiglobifer]